MHAEHTNNSQLWIEFANCMKCIRLALIGRIAREMANIIGRQNVDENVGVMVIFVWTTIMDQWTKNKTQLNKLFCTKCQR